MYLQPSKTRKLDQGTFSFHFTFACKTCNKKLYFKDREKNVQIYAPDKWLKFFSANCACITVPEPIYVKTGWNNDLLLAYISRFNNR